MNSFKIILMLTLVLCASAFGQCPPTPLPFIDNFDFPELDSCWAWIREDTSHWSLTERPGWMRITTQDGEIEFSSNRNMLLRPKPSGYFVIESHVAIRPQNYHNGLGILLYNEDNQFVLLQRDAYNQVLNFFDPSTGLNIEIGVADTNFYLSLEVYDSLVSAKWSGNGETWNLLASHISPWLTGANYQIGIEAKNGGTPGGLEIPADFDYFRVDEPPDSIVCGNVSGVWDSTGSPYYVTCDVTVPAGQTLEIRPGVQVLFTGHYKFNVFGNLQAIGTEQDSIIFTRAFPTEESKWWGVRFQDSSDDSSRLEYCVIEYGLADSGPAETTQGGGLIMVGCSPTVFRCTIKNCWARNGGGIATRSLGSPLISHCRIESNTALEDGGGLAFGNSMLVRCVIAGNHAGWRGGGMYLENPVSQISNCTIASNSAGDSVSAIAGNHGNMVNSVVWGNNGPGSTVYASLTATYSNIQSGYPGTGNIDTDPLCVDAPHGDFHLQATSPCIDTGDPNSPPDPDGTIADMGAFYFAHPSLTVSPESLAFGLQDLGADSTLALVLTNLSTLPCPILSLTLGTSAFAFDSSGLNGSVPGQAQFTLPVSFVPTQTGSYEDTLVIVSQSMNPDTLRVPLSGEAQILLAPLDSVVASLGAGNVLRLDWPPVTHTITGQPFTPPRYRVYAANVVGGTFTSVGTTTTNNYTNPFFIPLFERYYFRVTAETE